jgi:hypothetical protein
MEENENLALNEETGTEEETEDATALKEKLKELSDKNRQLFERAKKAEGFEKNPEGRWIKPEKPEPEPKSQPIEPDYAKLAYLETKGIIHPDDQKLVQDEAMRLKLPLTDVLAFDHIKSKLTANKDQREAQEGMPKGKGSASGKTQNDVDYWLAKGETPDDLELAGKVIEARIKKETTGNRFSDELYSG